MSENQDPTASGEHSRTKIQSSQRTVSLDRADSSDSASGYSRPYANVRRNSRLAMTLPDGRWETKWHTDLDPFFPFAFVLQTGSHIILQGQGRWSLFDRQGQSLAGNKFGDSEIAVDDDRSLAYMADPFGRGMAVRLLDGQPEFVLPLKGTNDYRRTFLERHDNFLIAASSMRHTNPHNPVAPAISSLEVNHLGDSLLVADGFLLSSVRQAIHTYTVERLFTAMHSSLIIVALENRIYQMDLDLTVQSELTDSFTPLAMSLDETGRIYLIVRTLDEDEQERQALWVISLNGEREIDTDIPSSTNGTYVSPVVGFDHRIYLILGDRILAVNAEGDVLWNQPLGAVVAGAVVTADDQLLVTAGNYLFAFNAQGERTVLFHLENDHWTTPPVLTGRGRLFIASAQGLYCLEPIQ